VQARKNPEGNLSILDKNLSAPARLDSPQLLSTFRMAGISEGVAFLMVNTAFFLWASLSVTSDF
jgi:hypothetical protein